MILRKFWGYFLVFKGAEMEDYQCAYIQIQKYMKYTRKGKTIRSWYLFFSDAGNQDNIVGQFTLFRTVFLK